MGFPSVYSYKCVCVCVFGGRGGLWKSEETEEKVCSMKNRFETLPNFPPFVRSFVVSRKLARARSSVNVGGGGGDGGGGETRWRWGGGWQNFCAAIPAAKVRAVGRKACKTFRPCAVRSRGGPYAARDGAAVPTRQPGAAAASRARSMRATRPKDDLLVLLLFVLLLRLSLLLLG